MVYYILKVCRHSAICSIWRLGLRDTHGETKEQDNRLSVFSHTTNDVKEAPGREDEMSGDSRYSVSNHTTDNVKEATGKEDEASGET